MILGINPPELSSACLKSAYPALRYQNHGLLCWGRLLQMTKTTSVWRVWEHRLGFCYGTNNSSMWDESSERTYNWNSSSFVFSEDDAKSHVPRIFSAMQRRDSATRWLRYCSLAIFLFDICKFWLKLVNNPNYSMWHTWTVWIMSIASLKATLSLWMSEDASDKRRMSVETSMSLVVRWRRGLGCGFWRVTGWGDMSSGGLCGE